MPREIKQVTQNFIEFIRERGIIGLAIGFMLGGSVSRVVSAFVTDIINPLVGIFVGRTERLKELKLTINAVDILWGDFIANFIDFLIIAAVVYFVLFKGLRLYSLEKKKE